MSERKRLTDEEVANLYRAKAGGMRQRDHLQAREDVKRLVDKIRKLATHHEAGDGTPLCWTEGGCCVRPDGAPSRRCAEIRLLLSEVAA